MLCPLLVRIVPQRTAKHYTQHIRCKEACSLGRGRSRHLSAAISLDTAAALSSRFAELLSSSSRRLRKVFLDEFLNTTTRVAGCKRRSDIKKDDIMEFRVYMRLIRTSN